MLRQAILETEAACKRRLRSTGAKDEVGQHDLQETIHGEIEQATHAVNRARLAIRREEAVARRLLALGRQETPDKVADALGYQSLQDMRRGLRAEVEQDVISNPCSTLRKSLCCILREELRKRF